MLMLLPLTLSLLPAPVAIEQTTYVAQDITPAADGTNTRFTVDGNTFRIFGGTPGDTNLFHSFEQFSLSRDQVANFEVSPNVQNVVGRIIGGDVSSIDGLLQVTGSNANLFLVNPSGIIFGPNASFKIGGSFTATTSDRLSAGNNWWTNWNSQLFRTPNDPNSVVFTVGAPAIQSGDPSTPVRLGSQISLTNGVFLSGDLTLPSNGLFITGVNITTGNINTASAVGSIHLNSNGDITTGVIDDFISVSLISSQGNITVHSIRSGPGGINISAPLGVFRAERAINGGIDFPRPTQSGLPPIFDLSLKDYPELVTFLEAQNLLVRDPTINEPYPATISVVFPDCGLGGSCPVPISLWVILDGQSQLSSERLIRIEHRGQSLTALGITIQGSGSDAIPAFVAGPSLSVSNPQLFSGELDSFDPTQMQQGFILSVSPSFRALNLTSELPPGVSGTVGGIFITPSNASVLSSILNRPFVPPVVVTPPPVVVTPPPVVVTPPPVVVTPPPVVVTPPPVVVTPPPVVVTLILLEESSSSVVDRRGQEPTVSSHQANAPLLSIAEDALTRPCSVSELTIAADGRYLLSGCEP